MRKYKIEDTEFSEINITPFTDVVLVLLLIFMVASPIIVSGGLKINLPKAKAADKNQSQTNILYYTKNKDIYLNSEKMDINVLYEKAKSNFKKRNNYEVIVNADEDVKHGEVIMLIDIIKRAGANKFMIATQLPEN